MAQNHPVSSAPAKDAVVEAEQPQLDAVVIGITVNDLPGSVAWYRDILGCEVAKEWVRDGKMTAATMRAGSVEFLLQQDDFAKGRDRQKGEGLRLYLVTRQEVDRLAAAVKSRGGKLVQEPTNQRWGARDFAIVDPDGFKISITTRW